MPHKSKKWLLVADKDRWRHESDCCPLIELPGSVDYKTHSLINVYTDR